MPFDKLGASPSLVKRLTLSRFALILEMSLSTDRIKTDSIGCYCPIVS
jgi:hypothetical protein